MFGSLFDETESSVQQTISKTSLHPPPGARLPCGLVGIENAGATCYLNSLLQTLVCTPEFRQAIFSLSEQELGKSSHIKSPIRIIPDELKKLFAQLMLSNRQYVSTTQLTESFGWNNNEEHQQHDVQELNRILFSAIDESLVGTSGQTLIHQLYHGTIVNEIKCLKCGQVSEREEIFLDITVAVTRCIGLEDSLAMTYCGAENLEGKNQYRCEKCAMLVNAQKMTKIRTLPPVLTFSLLRFNFDFVKMTRYKENGRFTFPLSLDMAAYAEKSLTPEESEYELFSVVIHRGSAYGGHYHAYIRDIDNLGTWSHPDSSSVKVPTHLPSRKADDYIDCNSPVELIAVILSKQPEKSLPLDRLCGEICKQTGVSWNKRFKKSHGPINKFIKQQDKIFSYNVDSNWVSLLDVSFTSSSVVHNDQRELCPENDHQNKREIKTRLTAGPSTHENLDGSTILHAEDHLASVSKKSEMCEKCFDDKKERKESSSQSASPDMPKEGYRWFNFDDSRISPILCQELEKVFEGKESAYMLFYRNKSLTRPTRANGNAAYGIPDALVAEIMAENNILEQQRAEYDQSVNEIKIELHFEQDYHIVNGALVAVDVQHQPQQLVVDRRQTLQTLCLTISEFSGRSAKDFTLHCLKNTPAGFHLYEEFADRVQTLQNLHIQDDTKLFVWNGKLVQGTSIATGVDCEPLILLFDNESNWSFPKNMTLAQFYAGISQQSGISPDNLQLLRVAEEEGKMISLNACCQESEDAGHLKPEEVTLEMLGLNDFDHICLRDLSQDRSISSTTTSSSFSIKVENRCNKGCEPYPVDDVEVNKNMIIAEMKASLLARLDISEMQNKCRLREEHPTLGLRPSYHEELTVADAGLRKGVLLILEAGTPPLSNEMTLTFMVCNTEGKHEIIVSRSLTVEACMVCMVQQAGLQGLDWHLRRTNWCGEAGEVIDDGELTLESCLINDGDHLLVEKGRLPPKGYIHLYIWLYPSPRMPPTHTSKEGGSTLNWITNSLAAFFRYHFPASEQETQPILLGELDIAKESTLEDLRCQILSLPSATDMPVLMPDHLRIRQIENQHLRCVFRGSKCTLRRLKVSSHNHLGVQILTHKDFLSTSHVVLNVRQRDSSSRSYGPAYELIWNTSLGSSLQSLKQAIADLLGESVTGIAIAKHFPHRFEWMLLTQPTGLSQLRGKKGRKRGDAPNIRQSPFLIQDGDTIGVKTLIQDPEDRDDFTTVEDDNGKNNLLREAEEKKKARDERRKLGEWVEGPVVKRPEIALRIKVDHFT